MARKTTHHAVALPPHGIHVESHAHGPDFKVARHVHACHSLIHVVSGQGRCVLGRTVHDLSPGHAILIRSGRAHELIDTPGDPMVVFVVYFSPAVFSRHRKLFEPVSRLTAARWLPPPRARRARQALREMLHEQQRRALKFDAAIDHCLCSLIVELHRVAAETGGMPTAVDSPQRRSRQRVQNVVDYLADHYFETCNMAEAARMARLSQRRFRTIFRAVTGRGFSRHIHYLRLARAAALLEQTALPVSAIAFEVGYEEISTFYRAFRREIGISPLAYRQCRTVGTKEHFTTEARRTRRNGED
ncbi:MAG TPA: hypothetical protein DD670_09035 [Planctomycetaceae bacterium]|nr:hypothetical protein [Planctomycetaceae bacterium]